MKKYVFCLLTSLIINLFAIVLGSYNLNAQDPRPGIECGCATYGKYVSPALEAPKMGRATGENSTLSPSGKYEVTASPGIAPNTVYIAVTDKECGVMVISESLSAYKWGFDPEEKYFLVYGGRETQVTVYEDHWVKAYKLDPQKEREGEQALLTVDVPPSKVYTPVVQFSPHGHYILYAYITYQNNLSLQVYHSSSGNVVFDGSTNALVSAYENGGNAGWGFSSDKNDATFVLSYLTGPDTYSLFVKRLGTADDYYILQAPDMTGGAYWRFSPCGDYFAWIHDNIGNNRHYVRFFSTADGTEYQGVDAEWFKHLEYTEEGHYLVLNSEGLKVRIDLPMANGTCPDRDAPTWPSGAILDTANLEGTRVNLYWPPANDNIDVSAYKVFAGSKLLEELSAEDTAFLVKGLLPETPYTLGVSAGDETGNWSSKLSRTIETPADNPPWWPYEAGIAQGPDLKLLTSTEVPVFWTPAEDDFGVLGYALSIYDTPHDTIYGRSDYLFKKLEPDMSYTFSVQAYDAAGNWSPILTSGLISTKPDNRPTWPSPDSELSFRDVAETTIPLHWPHADDDFGVTGYEVLLEGELIHTTQGYDTSYIVTGLEEGTTYAFAIVARDTWRENRSDTLKRNISTLAPFIEKPLMVGYGSQTAPDIHDHIIVWEDNRNGDYDIYMCNLKTRDTARVTDNPADQRNPRVWREWIVWEDHRNGNKDIYLYDPILGERAICTHPSDQSSPDIYGSDIVWSDARNGDTDIYLYDLEKGWEIVICDAEGDQNTPSVSKYRMIAWEDNRNGNPDIYMYLGSTEEEAVVCNNSGIQSHPVIWSECKLTDIRIAYADKRSTTWDIYLYYPYYLIMDEVIDWTMKLPLDSYATGYSNQELPHLEGDKVVYLDDRGGEPHIYEWRIANRTQGEYSPVCLAEGGQYSPRTSKGRIVWPDIRNGNWDLYIWDRPPGSDIELSMDEVFGPVKVNEDIIYKLNIKNTGPDDAENVVIRCTFPQSFKHLSDHIPGHKTSSIGNIHWCEIPLLHNDSTLVWTLRFSSEETGRYTLIAEAEGGFFDPDPSNNKLSETIEVSLMSRKLFKDVRNFGMGLSSDNIIQLSYLQSDSLFYAWRSINSDWTIENLGESTIKSDGDNTDIVKDKSGRVHIVQAQANIIDDNTLETEYYLYHHIKTGKTWEKSTIGYNREGFHFLDLELDSDDELHLSYLCFDPPGFYEPTPVMYMKTMNHEWGPPQRVWTGYDDVSLALDSEDNPHLSFYNIGLGSWGRGILYSNKENAVDWDDPEEIDPEWGGAQLEFLSTSIKMDGQNQPHVSFVGNDYDYGFESLKLGIKKEDGWEFHLVDSGYYYSGANAIDLDPSGGNHIFYANFKAWQMRYSFNYSGVWIKQLIDNKRWPSQDADIIMDRMGNLHMVYTSYDNNWNNLSMIYVLRPPMPYIVADTNKIDFGCTDVGTSVEKSVLIKNPGMETVAIDSISVVGSPFFKVSPGPMQLGMDESDSLFIQFEPSSEGKAGAAIRVWFNGIEKMFIDIEVTGRTPMPIIKVDYERKKFVARIGETDTCRFYVSNQGDSPLEISNVEVIRRLGPTVVIPTDFNLCCHDCSTLEPGDTCAITVTFSPKKSGYQLTTLYIYNSSSTPVRIVSLNGDIAKPGCLLSEGTLNFGYVPAGSSKQQEVFVLNPGSDTLKIYSFEIAGLNPEAFEFNQHCTSVLPGDSCQFTVTFSPVESGDFSAQLDISQNTVTSVSHVQLKGTTLLCELTVSPKEVDFGSIPLENQSEAYITIENSGETDIQIDKVHIAGLNSWEFSNTGVVSILKVGEITTDTVRFTPVFAGEKEACYIVEYVNTGQGVNDTVFLKGTGLSEPLSLYTLTGKVYSQDSTVIITSGTAGLYSASNAEPDFEYPLTSEGGYLFGELASGSYRVKITPDTISFPGHLPTYSGGVLTLYEAEVVSLAGNETLNIYCLSHPDEGNGLGSISGEVLNTFRKAGMKLEYDYKGDGTPIPGIMVYLKEYEAGLLKGADRTGTKGDFSFNGLEDGLYNMVVDYRGIRMSDDNTILGVGSGGRDIVVNALVSADEISVKVVVTGIENWLGTFGAWRIYPNPTDGVFCVIIEGLSLHGFLKIVDNSGRIIYDNKYVTGDYIHLEFLESGIYLLNFRYNDSIYYSKLIIN